MFQRTRIAPTPSGYLHQGNGFSFLLSWALARRNKLNLLLRIDDLDRERFRPEFLEDIFNTLEWLGINYDEGPRNAMEFDNVWSQQLRLSLYQQCLDELQEKGMVYACTCTRAQIRGANFNYLYPGTCRDKSIPLDQEGAAWRIRVPDNSTVTYMEKDQHHSLSVDSMMGDFVVKQKDGSPAYQIASLSDDLYFKVDTIVRGEDLLSSTAAQLYVAKVLGKQDFLNAQFIHHPLLLDSDGQKLSKSAGAQSLKSWREAGKSPVSLIQQVATWLEITKPSTLLRDLL